MDGDKRLEILGYMNKHMPKTVVGYKIKDAVQTADSYLDLPEIMVRLLCQLADENETLRATNNKLMSEGYKVTYVHQCNAEYGIMT